MQNQASVAKGKLSVHIFNNCNSDIDLEKLINYALKVLEDESIACGELSFHLESEKKIAELNELHMGKSGPTDVLSFPLDTGGQDNESDIPVLLGDIILCPAVALTQAVEHSLSFDEELFLLVTHGILHIFGHDHIEPEEKKIMQEREAFHLDKLGFVHKGWHV